MPMKTSTKTDGGTARLPAITHPVLILVRGLPGSGKSYLADALTEALGKERVVILDPDEIDQHSQEYRTLSASLTTEGVDEIFHPNRFLKAKGREGIDANKIIIWTQAFTHLQGFKNSAGSLQAYAAEHNTPLPVLLVEIAVDREVAQKRVAQREAEIGRSVPPEAFARFIRDYRSFAGEGFKTVAVNGEDDVAVSVTAVLNALKELL